MRIGTWNLDGRWDARHRDLVARLECDVLLMTEVPDQVDIPGMRGHRTTEPMVPGRAWAGVFATEVTGLADPHPAAALATVDGLRVCSSVLPWQGSGRWYPWGGDNDGDRTAYAVDAIAAAAPRIWGGDWNTSFAPTGYAVAPTSRTLLWSAAMRLGLVITTTALVHQEGSDLTIDHIAVPTSWSTLEVEHHRAECNGVLLSDHDAYVVEVHRT
ncbi:endonuclease/exonuclease/phosphatase family protein [Nocardioides panacisoli]|uniref:Endonuclease/exonuclease/phosphatase domain-containing protein n=1 Tax=Nocardioides panacisoli TaxID=627624 RepID=A0ABP7HT42_9ACTN